jgi:hypothetical protein
LAGGVEEAAVAGFEGTVDDGDASAVDFVSD